jgi:hypothetical protein
VLTLVVGATTQLSAVASPHAGRAAPFSSRPAKRPSSSEAFCRSFVQKFYDGYLTFAKKEHQGASCDLVLKSRPALFSREIRRQMAEDSAAQAKNKEEIVGIDFDPFLAAQDFADRYVAKTITRKGPGYLVEVHTINGGKPSSGPNVVPELVRSGKGWRFVNFHYPDAEKPAHKSDLLTVLKELRDERRKGSR